MSAADTSLTTNEAAALTRALARRAQEVPLTKAIGAMLGAEPEAAGAFARIVVNRADPEVHVPRRLVCVTEAPIDTSGTPSPYRHRAADLLLVSEADRFALLVEAKLRAALLPGQLDDYLGAAPAEFRPRLPEDSTVLVVVIAGAAIVVPPRSDAANRLLGVLTWSALVEELFGVRFRSMEREDAWETLLRSYMRRGRFGSRAATHLPARAALDRMSLEAAGALTSTFRARGVRARAHLWSRQAKYVSGRGKVARFALALSSGSKRYGVLQVKLDHGHTKSLTLTLERNGSVRAFGPFRTRRSYELFRQDFFDRLTSLSAAGLLDP